MANQSFNVTDNVVVTFPEILRDLKPVIAAKAKENQGERTDLLQKSAESSKPIDTRQEIAKAAGVSHDTIAKVEKIEQQASPEIIKRSRQCLFPLKKN